MSRYSHMERNVPTVQEWALPGSILADALNNSVNTGFDIYFKRKAFDQDETEREEKVKLLKAQKEKEEKQAKEEADLRLKLALAQSGGTSPEEASRQANLAKAERYVSDFAASNNIGYHDVPAFTRDQITSNQAMAEDANNNVNRNRNVIGNLEKKFQDDTAQLDELSKAEGRSYTTLTEDQNLANYLQQIEDLKTPRKAEVESGEKKMAAYNELNTRLGDAQNIAEALSEVNSGRTPRGNTGTPLADALRLPYSELDQISQNTNSERIAKYNTEKQKLDAASATDAAKELARLKGVLYNAKLVKPDEVGEFAKKYNLDLEDARSYDVLIPWANNLHAQRDEENKDRRARFAATQEGARNVRELDEEAKKTNYKTYQDLSERLSGKGGLIPTYKTIIKPTLGKTDAASAQAKVDFVAKFVDPGAVEGGTRSFIKQELGFDIWGVDPAEMYRRLSGKNLTPEVNKKIEESIDRTIRSAADEQESLNGKYGTSVPKGVLLYDVPKFEEKPKYEDIEPGKVGKGL